EAPRAPDQVTSLIGEYAQSAVKQGLAPNAYDRLTYLRQALYDRITAAGAGTPADVSATRVAQMLDRGDASPHEITAAEALLARWAGLPSRIGYGYYGGDKLADGSFDVHPRHGAMWMEAYFGGHGWIPLVGVPPKAKPSTHPQDKNDQPIQESND